MTASVWRKTTPAPPKKHVVADVRFIHREPQDQAAMSCSCGWSGIVAEYPEHRNPKPPNDKCRNGHDRIEANTYTDRHGVTSCLICRREQARAAYAKKTA